MKFSPAEHVAAVNRSLSDGTRDGRDVRILTAERTFSAPIDDVWDALTTADRIYRWMMPIEGDLRLGGKFQLKGNAGGEILECDPPKHFAISWGFGPSVSWVDVYLETSDEGTALRLEHSALVEDLTGDHYVQFGPGAVGMGWEMSLMGLAEHLVQPDYVVREGDVASMDLSEFMTESSNGWRDAAIAIGEDPEQATAAAERCRAAYAGE